MNVLIITCPSAMLFLMHNQATSRASQHPINRSLVDGFSSILKTITEITVPLFRSISAFFARLRGREESPTESFHSLPEEHLTKSFHSLPDEGNPLHLCIEGVPSSQSAEVPVALQTSKKEQAIRAMIAVIQLLKNDTETVEGVKGKLIKVIKEAPQEFKEELDELISSLNHCVKGRLIKSVLGQPLFNQLKEGLEGLSKNLKTALANREDIEEGVITGLVNQLQAQQAEIKNKGQAVDAGLNRLLQKLQAKIQSMPS